MDQLAADETSEGRQRGEYADLTRRAIARAVDPSSPDFLNFTRERQPLVDAAFLAQGILRAPRALRESLGATTTKQLVAALESTRAITPVFSNWLLFSATVEAALARLGATWDRMRVDYALRQHDQWYRATASTATGRPFTGTTTTASSSSRCCSTSSMSVETRCPWKELAGRVEPRARRYAAILERLVAPDGTFPAVGRSIAYRFGAFQLLAQMALRKALPEEVTPAQVRGALTAIIRRSIEAPAPSTPTAGSDRLRTSTWRR